MDDAYSKGRVSEVCVSTQTAARISLQLDLETRDVEKWLLLDFLSCLAEGPSVLPVTSEKTVYGEGVACK